MEIKIIWRYNSHLIEKERESAAKCEKMVKFLRLVNTKMQVKTTLNSVDHTGLLNESCHHVVMLWQYSVWSLYLFSAHELQDCFSSLQTTPACLLCHAALGSLELMCLKWGNPEVPINTNSFM